MTKDEIARMMQDSSGMHWGTEAHFQRFAKLVYEKAWADTALAATHTVTDAAILKEREACAKVCDKLWNAAECAEAIRARGNT
jgi:hypothetical protein